MLWGSSALSEFCTSLSKLPTLWHCVKVKQRYQCIQKFASPNPFPSESTLCFPPFFQLCLSNKCILSVSGALCVTTFPSFSSGILLGPFSLNFFSLIHIFYPLVKLCHPMFVLFLTVFFNLETIESDPFFAKVRKMYVLTYLITLKILLIRNFHRKKLLIFVP